MVGYEEEDECKSLVKCLTWTRSLHCIRQVDRFIIRIDRKSRERSVHFPFLCLLRAYPVVVVLDQCVDVIWMHNCMIWQAGIRRPISDVSDVSQVSSQGAGLAQRSSRVMVSVYVTKLDIANT